MTAAKSFATVADRLGKLIPRLASDYDGEVVATVDAIARTLAGAGLDWHDLAARIVAPTLADLMAPALPRPQPAPEQPKPAEPVKPSWCSEADWARAQRQASKSKKEPPPWPTWGRLSHFGHIDMFDEILKHATLKPEERARLVAAQATYYKHQNPPSRKDVNTFNKACRDLWERGARPEKAA